MALQKQMLVKEALSEEGPGRIRPGAREPGFVRPSAVCLKAPWRSRSSMVNGFWTPNKRETRLKGQGAWKQFLKRKSPIVHSSQMKLNLKTTHTNVPGGQGSGEGASTIQLLSLFLNWGGRLSNFRLPHWHYRLPRWHSGKESTCQCRRCQRDGLNPWVGKIPWRRKWQPTPVFFLGNPIDRGVWKATVHGVTKSQTRLSN